MSRWCGESRRGQILGDRGQRWRATRWMGWLLDGPELTVADSGNPDAPGITYKASDKEKRGIASKVQTERAEALADTIW